MTSSKAFRCVQAWLQEKWADDPCLAAAQMAKRPPTKRPREDALLEAERSHQRRRIELLNKHLLGEEAEVRRLKEQCFAASTDLEEIMSEVSHVSAALQAPATRSQRTELALRWFEAHDTWDCTSNPLGSGAEFSDTPVRHLFRPPLQAKPCPHLPALGGDYPVYLFAPGYLVDPVGAPAFHRLNPDPNHIPDLDFRAGHLVLGPAPDVAQSNLCHFGVRVGEVRRHLRGSVLPSVDLAQDVGQREVPLPPPARSGRYATQHGLLDGADDALREVGVAPGHLLLDVPEIHQLLELPLELGAVVGVHVGRHPQGLEHLLHARRGGARKTVLQRLRGHFLGQRIDGHQHEGVWLAPEGLHVGQVYLQLVHGLQRHEAVVASLRPVLVWRCWGRAPGLAAASALCCRNRCGDPRRRP